MKQENDRLSVTLSEGRGDMSAESVRMIVVQLLGLSLLRFLHFNFHFSICKHKKSHYLSAMTLTPGDVLLLRGKTPTTIGAEELNFRVRDGNGCDLFAIGTRLFELVRSKPDKTNIGLHKIRDNHALFNSRLSPRSISICQLHTSPRFHPRPINLIFFEGSYLLA